MPGDGAFRCTGRGTPTPGRASVPGAVRPRASGLSACSPQERLRERARGFFRPGTPPCDERGEMRQPTSEPMADLLGGVTVHSRAAERTPVLPLTFEGRGAADAHRALARSGVHTPAGSFHALEPPGAWGSAGAAACASGCPRTTTRTMWSGPL